MRQVLVLFALLGDLLCSAGHTNPPSNSFCGVCGQVLDTPADGEDAWAALDLDDEVLREVQAKGITPAQALEWRDVGPEWGPGVEWLLGWRGSEFTDDEAKSWCEVGVYFPAEAVGWIESGLPRTDVAGLQKAGIYAEKWPGWAAAGFLPQDAITWANEFKTHAIVSDPADIDDEHTISVTALADWRSAGFSAAHANQLVCCDMTSAAEAGRWRAAGVSVEQTINRMDDGLEAVMTANAQGQRERDYPAGPMDKRAADSLLKSLVKDRGLSATITINHGRGPFNVKSPVWIERVAVFGTGSVYMAEGIQFTAAQVVNITVKGRV